MSLNALTPATMVEPMTDAMAIQINGARGRADALHAACPAVANTGAMLDRRAGTLAVATCAVRDDAHRHDAAPPHRMPATSEGGSDADDRQKRQG